MSEFADRFEQLLIDYPSLSDAELSRLTGRSRSVVKQWHGIANPNLESLVAMSNALGLGMDWLLGDDAADRISSRARRAFAQLLQHLAGQDDWRDSTPTERVAYCMSYLRPLAPEFLYPWLWAYGLRIKPETVEALQRAEQRLTDDQARRFSELTGISREWILNGDPSSLCPPDISTWIAPVLAAQARGMAPEDLLLSLNVAHSYVQQLRQAMK